MAVKTLTVSHNKKSTSLLQPENARKQRSFNHSTWFEIFKIHIILKSTCSWNISRKFVFCIF